jgi:phosphatidylinositol alpha-1,6-mannosyltransferase
VRLAVVTNDYPPRPGGIQQYLGSLLAAYPHPVRVLGPADPAGDPHEVHGHIEVVRSGSVFMWPTPAIGRWVGEQAADFGAEAVLFGAPTPLPSLGPALRDRLGAPYGVLAHGAEVTIPARFPGSRSLLAYPLRRADMLFSNGQFTAGVVRGVTGRGVTVLGGGVDLDHFHPADPPPENDPPILGCVSRFVPRKGQDLVLRAAAELRGRGRPVEVLLVGKGRTEESLRRLAAELAVPTRFEVDVPWERLGGLYREMDVFCMPCRSRWAGLEVEGLGLVFLEAAAAGLPVVAGDSGGAPETVDPGRTGFVVRGVADIVAAVELLLDDPAEARAMGARGRARIEAEFTWELAAQRMLAGFTEAGRALGSRRG